MATRTPDLYRVKVGRIPPLLILKLITGHLYRVFWCKMPWTALTSPQYHRDRIMITKYTASQRTKLLPLAHVASNRQPSRSIVSMRRRPQTTTDCRPPRTSSQRTCGVRFRRMWARFRRNGARFRFLRKCHLQVTDSAGDATAGDRRFAFRM